MKTRSITKLEKQKQEKQQQQEQQTKYEVNIDFDEASRAWKANKKSTGNGSYKYICEATTKTGKKCKRCPFPGIAFCVMHHNKQNVIPGNRDHFE